MPAHFKPLLISLLPASLWPTEPEVRVEGHHRVSVATGGRGEEWSRSEYLSTYELTHSLLFLFSSNTLVKRFVFFSYFPRALSFLVTPVFPSYNLANLKLIPSQDRKSVV